MNPTAEELYRQREDRFNNIVALRKPDRVAVAPLITTYFTNRIRGVSNRDAIYKDVLRFDTIKEATLEFDWDLSPATGLQPAAAWEAIGTTQMSWPGHGLPDNASHQFIEGEYLHADEYDEFLAAPDHFTLTKIFPRIAANLEGLAMLPPMSWLANSAYLPAIGGLVLGAPQVRKAIQSLLAMSDAVGDFFAAMAAHEQEMAALGYPVTVGAPIVPPFDIVSDFLRGLKGSTLDMFRRPDKLLAAVDRARDIQIGVVRMLLQLSTNPRVFIPMHRGADGFMSDEQFEKFYWPQFKALVLAIIDAGGVPCPLFEGSYTSRLKYLAELPPGKIAAHFDKVDRQKFKEVLGDTMCFWGNVPASLMITGTPMQVKDDVKRLIDLFGDTGALIIDSTVGAPDEAKPENMHAMREAVEECGVF